MLFALFSRTEDLHKGMQSRHTTAGFVEPIMYFIYVVYAVLTYMVEYMVQITV